MGDTVDVNNPTAWSVARRYAGLLGPVPSSVGNAVKSMWKDHHVCQQTGRVEISKISNSSVRLLDRSSVLKMPLYFAAQSLYPERFTEVQEDDTSRALLKILHPGLFASFLSLLYMHRRFNKICPQDDWEQLSKEFVLNMELGYLIGKGCPRIGEAVGVLVGGIRYAALAILLKHDVEGYERYRNRKQLFELATEHERWRCDHGQIAGGLLRSFGFTSDQMQAAYALRGHVDGALSDEFVSWSVVARLMDGVKSKEKISAVDLSDLKFSLSDEELTAIDGSTNTLFEKGSTFTWMFRSSREDA